MKILIIEDEVAIAELEKDYLKALLTSDVVYCCNSNGYIGGTAMFELGYLIAKGQEVYFQEQPQEELISSLITEKLNICSPERLCEILAIENELWNETYKELRAEKDELLNNFLERSKKGNIVYMSATIPKEFIKSIILVSFSTSKTLSPNVIFTIIKPPFNIFLFYAS